MPPRCNPASISPRPVIRIRIFHSSKSKRALSTTPNPSNPSSSQPEIYDVVTVGGGPVGLALLAALKSSPLTSHLRTCLIESQPLEKSRHWSLPETAYSNRASSLTPSTISFLEGCGVYSKLDRRRIQPFQSMHVWDAGAGNEAIQFDWSAEARKFNAPIRSVATMVENANLTRALLTRIEELGGVGDVFSGVSVEGIESGGVEEESMSDWDLKGWPILSVSSTSNLAGNSANAGNSSESASSGSSRKIAARLLVGADGFNSPVRAFAGIDSKGWDYNRHGVVATLRLEPREDTATPYYSDELSETRSQATAYQRFLPQLGGPIAILPLPDNHASLVWSTTPSNAAYLKTLDEASLVAILNAAIHLSQTDIKYLFTLPSSSTSSASTTSSSQSQHVNELTWRLQHTSSPPYILPKILSVQPSTLASFPLRYRQATSYISPRIALVGDAAHTIHPLAGQGLNLGLGDIHSLSETLAYGVQHGMDLGDMFLLERYSAARYGRGLVMGGMVDVMEKMYSVGNAGGEEGILGGLVGRVRGLGMRIVNSPGLGDVVKGWVMRRAEG